MEEEIAIFSDIHGNKEALMSILNDIKKRNIKKVYCLGDTIGIGPNPKECLDLIIKNNVNMILGNHELYYLRGTVIDKKADSEQKEHNNWVYSTLNEKYKKFLNNCPLKIEFKFSNYKITMQHFLFKKENLAYPYEPIKVLYERDINEKIDNIDSNIIFIGHEHKAMKIIRNENKKLIDVGSSGCTKNEHTVYTILSLKDNKLKIRKVSLFYDREKFERLFQDANYPEKKTVGKIFFGIDIK